MKGRATTGRTAPRADALALLVLALALAASLRGAPAAHAADPKAAELQARRAFTAGEYAKALDIYVDLYGETRHPTYLRNIARCHQNLGHADKAIAGFREYLRKAKNVTPEQQAEVEKYIAEMEELKKKESAASSSSSASSPASAAPPPLGAEAAGSAGGGKTPVPKPAAVDLSVRAVPGDNDKEASQPSPFYTRVWFWAGVAALAAGIVATVLLVGADRGPAYGNLGHIDVPPAQQ
jgi:tetratricopeptide (TPR) repeat protein